MEFIIFGYININYLHCHNRRQQLDTLLASYNLKSTVDFPTRITNGSSTVIDNIFIDLSRNCTINPLINGLSDHDVQLLKLEKINVPTQGSTCCYVRNINSSTGNCQHFQWLFLNCHRHCYWKYKKGDDSKDNADPSNYLITNCNNMFSRINWKYATTYEISKILK